MLDGPAILPLERIAFLFCLVGVGLLSCQRLFPNGDKAIGRAVLVFGESELDPVGILAGGCLCVLCGLCLRSSLVAVARPCPNGFLTYRYAPVCAVRESRKVGHVSHVCVAGAYRSS